MKNFKLFDPELPKVNHQKYHGRIGAYFTEKVLGIKDSSIINAIRYHSHEKKEGGTFHLIIHIADSIEPALRDKDLYKKVMDFIDEHKKDKDVLTKAVDICSEFYDKK